MIIHKTPSGFQDGYLNADAQDGNTPDKITAQQAAVSSASGSHAQVESNAKFLFKISLMIGISVFVLFAFSKIMDSEPNINTTIS